MKQLSSVSRVLLGNAIALIILIVALYSQLGPLFAPMKGVAELSPIQPQPLRILEQTNSSSLRNPFDSGAVHWKAAENRVDTGGLHGVMLLPGVRAAVTGAGIVYPGGQVSGGRLAEITPDGLIVQQENQTHKVTLRAVPRPTLQTLNKAQPSASKEKK